VIGAIGAGSVGAAGEVARSEEGTGIESTAESALALAPESPRSGAAPVLAPRDARIAEDRVVRDRAMRALAELATPEGMLRVLQLAVRDSQSSVRIEGAQAAEDVADAQEALEARRTAEAEAHARESDMWSEIGNVLGKIAAVVAAVACLATSWCSGGATVVLAVGLMIAVFGPMVCEALGDAGVIPQEAALAAGIGCTVIGSALSFGAGAAGGAASAASQVAKVVADACQYTAASLQTAQGASEIVAATETGASMHALADAQGAQHAAEAATALGEEEVQELASMMRLFGRIAERLRRMDEARAEALRAAVGARA
jgi:hypothetical protein